MSFEIIAPKRPFSDSISNAKQPRTKSPFVTQQHAVLIRNFFSEKEIDYIIDANNDYVKEDEPEDLVNSSFKKVLRICFQKFKNFTFAENPIIIGKRNQQQPFHYDYKLKEKWEKNVLDDYDPNNKHITIITCLVEKTDSPIYVKRKSEFIPNEGMNIIDEISDNPLNECKEPNSEEIKIQMESGDIIVHQEEFTCHAGPKRPEMNS